MNAQEGILLGLALVTGISSLAILLSRSVFHAILFLLLTLLLLASIFIMLSAEFLAVVQLLIYAGGVVVLILFAVMLTGRLSGKPLSAGSHHLFIGILASLALFVLLIRFGMMSSTDDHPAGSTLSSVAPLLLSDYAAPLEVAGILLLISLVGAVVIAGTNRRKT